MRKHGQVCRSVSEQLSSFTALSLKLISNSHCLVFLLHYDAQLCCSASCCLMLSSSFSTPWFSWFLIACPFYSRNAASFHNLNDKCEMFLTPVLNLRVNIYYLFLLIMTLWGATKQNIRHEDFGLNMVSKQTLEIDFVYSPCLNVRGSMSRLLINQSSHSVSFDALSLALSSLTESSFVYNLSKGKSWINSTDQMGFSGIKTRK